MLLLAVDMRKHKHYVLNISFQGTHNNTLHHEIIFV